jgi:3-deoxy-manno-octulosonate cytidylyltransferase (CMP-KDO synthetase)
MIQGKSVACVVPARLKSTRFPHKVLKSLSNKPLLEWIFDKAIKIPFFDEVIFLVDALETADLVESFHGKWAMTDPACTSGTHRLTSYRATSNKKFDLWLNWQGDEPLLPIEMIEELLYSVDDINEIFTLKKKIDEKEAAHPNCVKVVADIHNSALYFSRSVIPYLRDPSEGKTNYFKHLGLYLYKDQALEKIAQFTPSPIETSEKLEQLTFLYNGMKIKVLETSYEGIGIDTPADLLAAEEYVSKQLAVLT